MIIQGLLISVLVPTVKFLHEFSNEIRKNSKIASSISKFLCKKLIYSTRELLGL